MRVEIDRNAKQCTSFDLRVAAYALAMAPWSQRTEIHAGRNVWLRTEVEWTLEYLHDCDERRGEYPSSVRWLNTQNINCGFLCAALQVFLEKVNAPPRRISLTDDKGGVSLVQRVACSALIWCFCRKTSIGLALQCRLER